MPYYKSIEEDNWLRLQRRNQRTNPSSEPSYLAPFKSMKRIELEWISAWYEQFMQHQQLHLWKRFESLSIGQKRALILDIAQDNHKPVTEHSKPDWNEWKARLSMIAEVPLQDEESFHEQRLDNAESFESFYMIKQSELLSPYREILLWLCYKGNHQGQQALLHTIDQLGIEAKKLLILRLNGKQKCTSLHFSQQLTIIQHEKTMVDWDRIMNQLQSLQQLADEEIHAELLELEPSSQSQMGPPNDLSHTMIDEDEEEFAERSLFIEEASYIEQDVTKSSLEIPHQHSQPTGKEHDQRLPLLPLSDRRNSLLRSLDSEHVLVKLLGHVTHGNQQKAMKRIDFVDLCLQIPHGWSSTKRDKARMKKIQSLNFSSFQQLFDFIITAIVYKLYENGVVKRNRKYVEQLQALSLMKSGVIPSEESITKQLLARFEQ